MFIALALKSAASSAILRVYASASTARSSAFLKRAVAISSIVRVILRMFRIALRRLTRARVLAIDCSQSIMSELSDSNQFPSRIEPSDLLDNISFIDHLALAFHEIERVLSFAALFCCAELLQLFGRDNQKLRLEFESSPLRRGYIAHEDEYISVLEF